jgi:hypothetical protein
VATIEIDVTIDSDRWSAGLEAMVRRLDLATSDASLAAAKTIQFITQGKLLERAHSELTFSPAPPGAPPAAVSGALAESIDTARNGPFGAMVGPTGLPYARIQELGGTMHGHPFMVFHKYYKGSIVKFKRSFVRLYPHPYLAPATDEAVNSGRVRSIYEDFWSAAIEA